MSTKTDSSTKQQEQNHFIFDCLGGVVGNQKGHRTFKGAQRMRDSKAIQDIIWSTYYSNKDKELASGVSEDDLSNHLSSIKLV